MTESQSPPYYFRINLQWGNSVLFDVGYFIMEVPPTIAAIFDRLDPPMRKRKLSDLAALGLLCYVLKSGVSWRHLHVKECGFSAVYK